MTPRLTRLLELLNAMPADAFTLFAIAKEYESAGDAKEALSYYLRLKASDPAYVGLYYHLGKLYETLGNETEALSVYETGIAIAQKAGDLHAASELRGAKMNLEIE